MDRGSEVRSHQDLQVQQSTKSTENSPAHNVSSSGDGDTSTDTACTICLGPLKNKSFTDSCFHMFCFVCLLEWSKVKAVCPLCKQPFSSIIHSVRSLEDYDRHYIQQPTEGQQDSAAEARFRYRTTLTADRWLRHLQREHNRQLQLLSTESENDEAEGVAVRRRVYESGIRSRLSSSGRVRNVSPAFLASHPACVHRLAAWLKRELSALLTPSTSDRRHFVLELVLELVTHFAIESADFAEHVRPFIGRHTSHFIHELRLYATSPYDLAGYDRRVRYNDQVDGSSTVISDEENAAESSDGSDVIVMSPNIEPEPEPSEVVDVLASPEPATSAEAPVLLTPAILPPVSPAVSSPLLVCDSPPVIKTEVFTSPGSDVEVTGYEKPWAERSPESVHSPTAAEEREEKRQMKRKAAALAAMERRWSTSSESDDSRQSSRYNDRKHKRYDKRRDDWSDRRERPERETREDRNESSMHRRRDERLISRHSGYDERSRRNNRRDDKSHSSARYLDAGSRSSRCENDGKYRDDDRRYRENNRRQRQDDRRYLQDDRGCRQDDRRYRQDDRRLRDERQSSSQQAPERSSRSSRDPCERGTSRTSTASRHRPGRDDRASASRHVSENENASRSHTSGSASVNPWSLGSLLAKKNAAAVEGTTPAARTEDNGSAIGAGRAGSVASQRSTTSSVREKQRHRGETTEYKKNSSGHKKSRATAVDSSGSD